MSDLITIYGHPVSPFVRKVLLALAVKGVSPAKIVPYSPFVHREELKLISPLIRIPVFQQGDFTLTDSSVISEYIEEAYEGAALYPAAPKERAKARWFEEYADTHLAECFVFEYFFEKVVKPGILKQPTDTAKTENAENNKIPEALTYLEGQLTDGGYLLGDMPYMADFSIGACIQNAMFAGWKVDAKTWPKVARFLSLLNEHPTFNKVASFSATCLAARSEELQQLLKNYVKP